jgi:uncharacterized protein
VTKICAVPTARLTRISIAPVKSLRVVHPHEVMLAADGVAGDRRFLLVDENGRLYNGKRDGRLVQIQPEWDEASRRLALEFPDGTRAEETIELGEPVIAEVFGQPVPAQRVLGSWDGALGAFLGRPVRLLWSERGLVDRHSISGSVTFLSQASLERLREQAGHADPVDGRRFRMLFEIDGVDAHAEDEWIGRRLRVGEATVAVTGDVGRCVVTTRNPETGVGDLKTLHVLAGYRRHGVAEPLPFGVYGAVVSPGRVRVGDAIEPLA